MGKMQDAGWGFIGICIMLGMWALSLLQTAAAISGLENWLGWHWLICALIATIIVFWLRLTLISAIIGIAGAHYAWDWSWVAAAAIFFGPMVAIMGFSMLMGLGAKVFRW